MDFNGVLDIKKDVKIVTNFLAIPENTITCLPGIYDIEYGNEDIKCRIKLDISAANISTMRTVTGKMVFKYTSGDDYLNVSGTGRITGSKVSFSIKINYLENGDKTALKWDSTFDFGMIMKIMGRDKIDEIAHMNIDNVMKCIAGKLEG